MARTSIANRLRDAKDLAELNRILGETVNLYDADPKTVSRWFAALDARTQELEEKK